MSYIVPGQRCPMVVDVAWFLRVLASMTLAPALPLAAVTLLQDVAVDWFAVSPGFVGALASAAAVLCFPVTWIAVPLLIHASVPEGRLGLQGYLVRGMAVGAGLSFLFPPALPLGVSFGGLVALGAWCCHWAFRPEEQDYDPTRSPLR